MRSRSGETLLVEYELNYTLWTIPRLSRHPWIVEEIVDHTSQCDEYSKEEASL